MVNETIALLVVGVLGASVVVGTMVVAKKEVPVESNEVLQAPVPVVAPAPPPPAPISMVAPPARIEAISKEIAKDNPSLSKDEIADAVHKANRLDVIEHRIDEVVVEQRKLSDRIESVLEKKGPEK